MNINEIYKAVSSQTDIPVDKVKRIYTSYWRAVREHIISLPLKEDLTDDEFMALRPNINIPSIGKLYVTLDRYKAMKKTYNKNIKDKEDATY